MKDLFSPQRNLKSPWYFFSHCSFIFAKANPSFKSAEPYFWRTSASFSDLSSTQNNHYLIPFSPSSIAGHTRKRCLFDYAYFTKEQTFKINRMFSTEIEVWSKTLCRFQAKLLPSFLPERKIAVFLFQHIGFLPCYKTVPNSNISNPSVFYWIFLDKTLQSRITRDCRITIQIFTQSVENFWGLRRIQKSPDFSALRSIWLRLFVIIS